MVHTVSGSLGVGIYSGHLYRTIWDGWRKKDCIHLLINHRYYTDRNSTIKEFDEINIRDYNRTFGIMAREVLKKLNFI